MICPKCGESSAVQSTRTLVSAGVSNTHGSAVTFPIFGEGEINTTYFGSSTTSHLAHRLMPPGQPVARAWPWVLSVTVLFTLIAPKAAYDSIFNSPGLEYFSTPASYIFSSIFFIFGLGIGFALGLIAGMIMRAIGNATWIIPSRAAWYPRAERVWSTYYCGRDDTMFDAGYAGSPEQFISYVWSTPLESEVAQPVQQSLVDSVIQNSQEVRASGSSRALNSTGFAALSKTLGQCSFEEARKTLKDVAEYPSVAKAIQKAKQAHSEAKISKNAALNMFREPSVAEMPFYSAVLPIGSGGYTEAKAIASVAALSHEKWQEFDDVLTNGVKAHESVANLELLLTAESVAGGYSEVLPSISNVIPDIEEAVKTTGTSFSQVWEKESGIKADAFLAILHSHRDVLLYADFYRESHKASDGPTHIWQELTNILAAFERGVASK